MNCTPFFDEMESIPNIYSPKWEPALVHEFNKGDCIIIRHINYLDDSPLWYFVELNNGKKGVMYFYMGD